MAFNFDELTEAQSVQVAAASDPSPQVRLVAGPGTGKSKTIEERVCWLLGQGVDQDRIAAVSFTRASAQDLSLRVAEACQQAGHEAEIRVGTLHALALRVLRRAGALEAYPVDPLVLDGWELENVFDAEFGEKAGVGSKVRRREIRGDFEALWSTGQHRRPTGQTPPDPPISDGERDSFRAFHMPRTHLYACVLPGELVQRCVERIEAGTLDPVTLLEIDHLIVDEFQDLNPMDLRFVDALAQRGVTVFVAGDDDQSLYSFRYAAPSGIRRFPETYPGAGDHSLRHCFRCTPAVLNAAETLIASNAEPERIPKEHVSMYDHVDPRVAGGVGCWRFTNDEAEARAIAQSIHHLCAEGMPARQIMIPLANANTLCRALLPALDDAGIAYEVPRTTRFKDTDVGRALMTALRLGVRDDDFVALRTLLALRRGVGVGTAAAIGDVVIANNLSYRDLFGDFDEDLVSGRQLSAIGAVRETVEQAHEWGPDDELREHAHQIDALLPDILNREPEAFWRDEFTELPDETTLAEALQYLAAEKDEQRARVLAAIHKRLGNDVAVEELLPDAVRVMTMHGAKGLSAQMVFIPGLEQEILPGPKRLPYTGLVLEAARMLYVSITRARLGCILSYAEWRTTRAMPERRTPSSFTSHLGTTFTHRAGGFSREVAHEAVGAASRL